MDRQIKSVLAALRPLRLTPMEDETRLQDRIETTLTAAGIAFEREVSLCHSSRIDFLTAGGVGIEIKRGKPAKGPLLRQLARYAASQRVSALILVTERSAALPREIGGKPCIMLSLIGNWGVAL